MPRIPCLVSRVPKTPFPAEGARALLTLHLRLGRAEGQLARGKHLRRCTLVGPGESWPLGSLSFTEDMLTWHGPPWGPSSTPSQGSQCTRSTPPRGLPWGVCLFPHLPWPVPLFWPEVIRQPPAVPPWLCTMCLGPIPSTFPAVPSCTVPSQAPGSFCVSWLYACSLGPGLKPLCSLTVLSVTAASGLSHM